jgi:PAS domain S-box-containing protein
MLLTTSQLRRVALDTFPPAATLIIDERLRLVDAEGSAFSRHGLRLEDCLGRPLREILPSEAQADYLKRCELALEGRPQSFDYWSEDRRFGYWVRIGPIAAAGEGRNRVVAVLHDITDRLRSVGVLERSEARLREAERVAGVGSWELRPENGEITYSAGFARLFGLRPDDRFDVQTFIEMIVPDDRQRVEEAIAECVETGTATCEYRVRRGDGTVRTILSQGEVVAGGELMIGALTDVSEEREAERERAAAQALFEQGFEAAPIGMALTDPATDRYVRVNDALCELLGRTAEEVLGHTYSEFTHPDDLPTDEDARRRMLRGEMSSFEGEKRYLHADGSSIWTSLHVAPVLRSDGSVETFFTQVVDIRAQKEREARLRRAGADATWLARIRRALDEDGLLLYSQPVVDLASGKTVQNELLLRMRGEEGSVWKPGEFLPTAERYGLISEIDRWVIGQALSLVAEGMPTQLNLSGPSIADPDVIRELERGLQRTGADPSLLVVEVTETAVVDDLEGARDFARRISELGCALALDDFGTGFANLSYLKHIPAQHLKIDIEFVRELARSRTDRCLVEGIVNFARAFDQLTIAEGVEDEETFVLLRELGVDMAQGFLLGRPSPLRTPGSGERPGGAQAADCADPVALVRTAFDAFARRDLDFLFRLCTDDVLVRPGGTGDRTGRRSYRGRQGLCEYFGDLGTIWRRLALIPQNFRQAEGSVIVFGEAEGEAEDGTRTADVVWVWRLRGDRVASVEVFPVPHRLRAAA